MKTIICKLCNQPLERNCSECYCGWKSSDSCQEYDVNKQCIYAASGQRCPLDGANNKSTHAGGSWYCYGHLRNLHDANKCHDILMHALINFREMMEEKIDWRVKLIPEEYAIRKKHIQTLFNSLKK